jgi:hypothetical protein
VRLHPTDAARPLPEHRFTLKPRRVALYLTHAKNSAKSVSVSGIYRPFMNDVFWFDLVYFQKKSAGNQAKK